MRLISRIVNDTKHKIRYLAAEEIDDPWYTGDFDGVYRQLYAAIESL